MPNACTLLSAAQIRAALQAKLQWGQRQGTGKYQTCTWHGEPYNASSYGAPTLTLTVAETHAPVRAAQPGSTECRSRASASSPISRAAPQSSECVRQGLQPLGARAARRRRAQADEGRRGGRAEPSVARPARRSCTGSVTKQTASRASSEGEPAVAAGAAVTRMPVPRNARRKSAAARALCQLDVTTTTSSTPSSSATRGRARRSRPC